MKMRETMMIARVPSDNPFLADVAELFNMVIGSDSKATVWWSNIRLWLAEKYGQCLTEEEKSPAVDLKAKVNLRILFSYLLKITGVKLKSTALKHLMENTHRYRFIRADLKSLDAKVSTGYLGPMSDALKLLCEVALLGQKDVKANDETIRLLTVCRSNFIKAHNEAPTCAVVLHRWANAENLLGKIVPEMRATYWSKALMLLEKSIKMWPGYMGALRDYALYADHSLQTLDATQEEQIKDLQTKRDKAKHALDMLENDPTECYGTTQKLKKKMSIS